MQPTVVCCNRTLHAASVDSNFTHTQSKVCGRQSARNNPHAASSSVPSSANSNTSMSLQMSQHAARLVRIHMLALLGRSTDMDKNAYQGTRASTQEHTLLESQCMGLPG